jgi:O-antigen/teichoic acid export membrane protein
MTTSDPGITKEAADDVRVVAKGGAVQVAGQVTQGVLSFIFVAVAVRMLGTDRYGIFRQVVQVLAIAAQLGLAGYNYSAMRFIARARATGDFGAVRGSARTALLASLTLSGFVFGALLWLAPQIAGRLADDPAGARTLTTLVRIGAAFVPFFVATQVLRYCTQAYKTLVPSVIVGNIVQPVARFAFGVSFLALGWGLKGVVVGQVLAAAVAALVGVRFFLRILTPEERSAKPHAEVGAITRFALLQGGSSLLGVQTLGLAILILGSLSSDRQVALMAIGLALQTPGTLFLGGVVNIWAPVVTDLYEKKEMARLESLYQTITRWVVTFSFPAFGALILAPGFFVSLFAGKNGAGAAGVVVFLALGNLFYTGTGPTGLLISMSGRPGINLINSVAAVALYISLGIWIVPAHGAVGMAVVDAIVTALINVTRVIEAKVLVGVQPLGKSLLKPLAAFAGLAAVLVIRQLFLPDGSLLTLGALIVSGAMYLLILKLLGADPEERHVLDLLKKRLLRLKRGA